MDSAHDLAFAAETEEQRTRRIAAYTVAERAERVCDLIELLKWNEQEMVQCVIEDPMSIFSHLTSACNMEIQNELDELEGRFVPRVQR